MTTEACATSDETTRTVLERRASGDEDGARAFLVTSTHASLSRFLRRLVRDEETARELFQETYLRAFRGLGSFRGEASITTWVLTIGRHLAMTRLGRDRARLRTERPLEPGVRSPRGDRCQHAARQLNGPVPRDARQSREYQATRPVALYCRARGQSRSRQKESPPWLHSQTPSLVDRRSVLY